MVPDRLDMGAVRLSIRSGRKIRLSYRDEQERQTGRTVWPFAVGYHESVRLVLAWCELRQDFRSFRTDRVDEAEFLEERYPERPAMLRARWRRQMDDMAHRMGMREARGRAAGGG
jgi:predicted DNA-binding transcriptional regulator YafY